MVVDGFELTLNFRTAMIRKDSFRLKGAGQLWGKRRVRKRH